ncbi:C6 transcription factor [Teratosphaeria destructans]|uniref:C6 transcription factor n=1 Tax=Teratosphaeria destructans TaxID=418781 RepID=A0A9W7SPV9_9PEZI|nr:C6 transcription factor [Teratosphaeria destructans]
MLCICRRLRLLDYNISGELLEKVLTQTSKALKAAQTNIDTGSPWHHDANVPFQIVCILLAIDNPLSIAQLGDAVRVLNNVVHLYDTDATREALSTASLLIMLHQRRKEADAKSLTNILRTYAPSMQLPQSQPPSRPDHVSGSAFGDSAWLDSLVNDMPNLQGFDMNTLFDSNGQWDVPVEWLGWINNG